MKNENQISVSEMSGKLTDIATINTNPLTDDFCNAMSKVEGTTCYFCFARFYLKTCRKFCVPRFENNTRLLCSSDLTIAQYPQFKKDVKNARCDGYGEMRNAIMRNNYAGIADYYNKINFTIWTKRVDLVKDFTFPKNVTLIYSSPFINKKTSINTFQHSNNKRIFDKVFTVYDDMKYIDRANCHGNCASCMKCYNKKDSTVYIHEIIKSLQRTKAYKEFNKKFNGGF